MSFAFRINSEVLFYREAIKNYEVYLKLLESQIIYNKDGNEFDLINDQQLPSLFIGIKSATLSIILWALPIESALNFCLINLKIDKHTIKQKRYFDKIDILNQHLTDKIDEQLKNDIIDLFKTRNFFVHYKELVEYFGQTPKILSIFYAGKMVKRFHIVNKFFKKISPLISNSYNPMSVYSSEVESEGDYLEINLLNLHQKIWYVCKHPYWYITCRFPNKIKYWKIKHNF